MVANLHFFQKKSTYSLISELSEPRDWTIYVGLGATFDRTNTSWRSLVVALFEGFGIDERDATNWIERATLVGAATALEALYLSRYPDPDAYVRRLREDIARQLYGPKELLKGQLLDRIAEFAQHNAARDHSVALVTPNYDAYLYRALEGLPDLPTHFEVLPLRTLDDQTSSLPQGWRRKGNVSCIHVHGFVSDDTSTEDHRGIPVLGEITYARSAARTQAALETLFKNRNVMIIGSSLSDGPLVNALITTAQANTRKVKRLVIQPLQGPEWRFGDDAELQGVLGLNTDRLAAMGLENTMPTHFGQTGQLLAEVSATMIAQDAEEITIESHPRRYERRLEAWWKKWSDACRQNLDVQVQHHDWLRRINDAIRTVADVGVEEETKLEVWARWDPSRGRELGLWASSVGTWTAFDAMRRDSITKDSDYRSVAVFCAGTPKIMHVDSTSRDRWKSYFGVPIWDVRSDPSLPVGVVTIASMWSGEFAHDGHTRGVIGAHNLVKLSKAMTLMRDAGLAILTKSDTNASRRRADRWIAREHGA